MKLLPPSPAISRADLQFVLRALLAVGVVIAFVACVHRF
jgi:hypothetical protein